MNLPTTPKEMTLFWIFLIYKKCLFPLATSPDRQMHLRSHSSHKSLHGLRSIDLNGQSVVLESDCSTKEKPFAVNNNILLFNYTDVTIIGAIIRTTKVVIMIRRLIMTKKRRMHAAFLAEGPTKW